MSFSASTRPTARSVLLFVAALVLLTITQAKAADSLYKRLGGYDAIAGFVDTAFPRVAAHPELNHLFRGHAVDSQMRQRQLIVDSICNAAGGPCLYTGRPMKPVHVGLGITGAQWDTFMKIIQTAADERKFGAAEKKEFLELFAKQFRPAVVEKP
jgi:hemoglobin